MTPRERLERALRHQEPDRVPVDFGSRSSAIEESAYRDLLAYLGLQRDVSCFLRSHAEMHAEILELLAVDTRWLRDIPPDSWRRDGEDTVFLDSWRVPWRKPRGGEFYDLAASPLKGLSQDQVLSTSWELLSDASIRAMRAEAPSLSGGSRFPLLCDVLGAGIFEEAMYLRGFEELILDLVTEPDFAAAFMDRILEAQIAAYERLFDAIGDSITAVLITDDLATQDSLLVSPETYRALIKPRQRRLLEFIHGRGVEVVYHSCGAVRPLIPDLIEIGVRILHPVQTSARDMDTLSLKKEFGDDLVFWGGGCDTRVLQAGTAEDVRNEVRMRLDHLAPGGGFVFTTTHCIQPGTPPRNIVAMVETLARYGSYR